MHTTQTRGQSGRPSTDEVTNPQAARETKIREVFTSQRRLLEALFPKDGAAMVARACAAAILQSRAVGKDGKVALAAIAPEDIAEKCIAALHMGLEPGSECYLIPYGGKLQLQIGPQGLIKLMTNTGMVRKIEARCVRAGDFFDYDLGDDGFIKHRKGEGNRAHPVTHAYAFIETTTGGKIREVLTVDDLEFYRSKSKLADGGPMWKENYEGAGRKTVIHRIAEFVPRSPMLSAALRSTDEGVEIPEEVMRAVRQRIVAETLASVGGGAGAGQAAPEVEHVAAGAAPERQMGDDDV